MDSNKVKATTRVEVPAGQDLGSFPQRTPPNPSQRGMNAPKEPPSHKQQGEVSPFQPDTSRAV
jgi:hypothetical protein